MDSNPLSSGNPDPTHGVRDNGDGMGALNRPCRTAGVASFAGEGTGKDPVSTVKEGNPESNMDAQTIKRRRADRTRFMEWLFKEANGSPEALVQPAEFPGSQSYDERQTQDLRDIIKYLEGEHLIKAHWTFGGFPTVLLTHHGIKEMEEALGAPDRETEHFVPINLIHVSGNVIGSQIQQGTSRSSQIVSFEGNEVEAIQAFIQAARVAIASAEFDKAFTAQAESSVNAIEKELEQAEPNWKLLRTLGKSSRVILESGLGGVLTQALVAVPWTAIL